MMPKTRVAVAVRPLPVPRSFAGNTSGESAYNTPYMICPAPLLIRTCPSFSNTQARRLTLLQNAYPQFHPRSALLLRAVVDANKKTPVSPIFRGGSLSNATACRERDTRPRRAPACPCARRTAARRPNLPGTRLGRRLRPGSLAVVWGEVCQRDGMERRGKGRTLRYVV